MHTTTPHEPGAHRVTTQPTGLVLVSHALCPYVQRVAIVLAEKGIPVERRDIDLANKPAWFLDISPLGKTPVLLVDGEPVFESAVICEYLDDTLPPRLHPEDPLQRARDRAWMEFGSAVLNSIAGFYNAADEAALQGRAREIRGRFEQLEHALGAGPFFRGEAFSVVDAVFGPVFRYFDTFDTIAEFGFMEGLPRVMRWRGALAARASVRDAVHPDYPERLMAFLRRRPSALAARAAACAL
ncbi:glutathione S-transferase family protein [Hydrogenophaga taeniospiralis]|uniref:glutathione S-transferase family protein n=1 Tax=Hydrogenophaga taeniospiralis TaxID=65656 RepID=UPI001CFAC445|nr:glutathione S-transferase family protein [Hydrogenophaga taeniospiralis]MCB4363673.1 glutathione S-transferase family protein [Hydrogenophaga taeniospiralis]